ncbi:MAG: HU family DNA-binding protein [Proteobacteria bacterium]|nr:HU family DNA-binding protein [Pseudomonadota bacterium]
MIKSEIVQKLSEQFNLPHKQARLIVDSIFNNMTRSLALGDKIILRGFGSFSIRVTRDRLSRNPKTGKAIHVSSRKIVAFRMSNSLSSRLNKES